MAAILSRGYQIIFAKLIHYIGRDYHRIIGIICSMCPYIDSCLCHSRPSIQGRWSILHNNGTWRDNQPVMPQIPTSGLFY